MCEIDSMLLFYICRITYMYDVNVEAKQKTGKMRTNRKKGEIKDTEVCKSDHVQKVLCLCMKIPCTVHKINPSTVCK